MKELNFFVTISIFQTLVLCLIKVFIKNVKKINKMTFFKKKMVNIKNKSNK